MSFKDISYLEHWWPLCSAERNHLCNIGQGHYQEHFCEVVLNLDQWFSRRCHFKIFLSRALVAILFGGVESFVQYW